MPSITRWSWAQGRLNAPRLIIIEKGWGWPAFHDKTQDAQKTSRGSGEPMKPLLTSLQNRGQQGRKLRWTEGFAQECLGSGGEASGFFPFGG